MTYVWSAATETIVENWSDINKNSVSCATPDFPLIKHICISEILLSQLYGKDFVKIIYWNLASNEHFTGWS